MLAQNIICRAQEQREAVLRGVRLRNRVGVSRLDWNAPDRIRTGIVASGGRCSIH